MPNIVGEWGTKKNFYSPDDVVSADRGKVWWICPKGHSYQMSPVHRREGKGCPYCANLRILVGYNDLATTHPELASEWDEASNGIPATAVTYGVDRKYFWICPNGHRYSASPINRSYNGTGCPYCATSSHTSFAEQAIYYYLSFLFYNVYSRVKLFDFEFDILLRDEKIVIEFNGEHWHSSTSGRDLAKKRVALDAGYRIIVVNSTRSSYGIAVSGNGSSCVDITCFAEKRNKLSIDEMVKSVISSVFSFIGLGTPDMSFVDSARDEDIIMKLYNGSLVLDTSEPV